MRPSKHRVVVQSAMQSQLLSPAASRLARLQQSLHRHTIGRLPIKRQVLCHEGKARLASGRCDNQLILAFRTLSEERVVEKPEMP
jgi:hypothetical protein